MDNKKSKTTMTILIIIIILLIGGYAVLIPGLISNNNQNSTNEGQNISKDSSEEYTPYVAEAFNKHINLKFPEELQPDEYEKNLNISWHIVLPKITIETANADIFNKKILNDYQNLITMINNEKQENNNLFNSATSHHINYDYYINDNIIGIIITNSFTCTRASSGTTYKGYYYSIAEDKELSIQDILNKYNITIDEINEKISELDKDAANNIYGDIGNIKDANDINAIDFRHSIESFTFYKGLQKFELYKPKIKL